jgi:PAS domain-containing protein
MDMTGLSAHDIAAAGPSQAVNHDAAHPVSLREPAGEGICGFDRESRCTFAIRARAQSPGYRTDAVLVRNMHQSVHHTHADRRSLPEHERPILNAYRQSLWTALAGLTRPATAALVECAAGPSTLAIHDPLEISA